MTSRGYLLGHPAVAFARSKLCKPRRGHMWTSARVSFEFPSNVRLPGVPRVQDVQLLSLSVRASRAERVFAGRVRRERKYMCWI